jgi:PHD/YefM family antitoxin component YafN of YafNO toxin-antitoxin module
MKTISVSEFRGNIKKYLDIAEAEKVIIHRGKGKSFAVIPIEEVEKSPYNPEFVKRVLQADFEIKEGKGVKIAIEDLWK